MVASCPGRLPVRLTTGNAAGHNAGMPLPPYRRPYVGEPLEGNSARRVLRDVESLSDITGTGDVGIEEGAGGRQFLDGRLKPIPARIIAQVPATAPNAYSFIRVDDGENDGTFPDLTGTTEQGDGIDLVAWELNGLDDVEPDTLVHLFPNLLGAGYTFEAGASSASRGVLLVEVTGYSSGTHTHTCKRKTWLATDVVDYSPPTSYTTCKNSNYIIADGAGNYELPVGTLCWMTPIPDVAGDYWISPIGNYASDVIPGTMSTYAQHFIGRKRFRSRTEIAWDGYTSGYVGQPTYDMEDDYPAGVFQVTKTLTILDCGTRTTGNVFVGPDTPIPDSLPLQANVFGGYPGQGLRCDSTILASAACGYQEELGSLASPAASFLSVRAYVPGGTGGPVGGVVGSFPGIAFHLIGYGATGLDPFVVYLGTPSLNPDYIDPRYPNGPHICATAERFGAPGFSISGRTGLLNNPDGSPAGPGASANDVILGGTDLVRLYPATDGAGGVIYAEFIGGLYIRLVRLGAPDTDPDPNAIVQSAGLGPTTLRSGNTYYADSPSGRSVFYLPLTAAAGDRYRIVGRGAAGWQINQRAGQTIRTGNAATTTGTGGLLQGPQWMSVEIECLNDGLDFVIAGGNSPIANGPITTPIVWT